MGYVKIGIVRLHSGVIGEVSSTARRLADEVTPLTEPAIW
jgi:hypothetical protein